MSLIILKLLTFLLVGVSIIGWIKYSSFDTSTRIIVFLITITCICESTALFTMIKYGNNLTVYYVFNPIQLLIISLFFNNSISFFKRRHIGYLIGIIGITFSITNWLAEEYTLQIFNTNFLVFETIVILIMSFCFFYSYLKMSYDKSSDNKVQFWLTSILFLFWTFTFFRWLIALSIPEIVSEYKIPIRIMMYTINILTYCAFGLVFLFYEKLQSIDRN